MSLAVRARSDAPAAAQQCRPAHALTTAETLALLGSRPEGLTTAEAARRLEVAGPNELAHVPGPTAWSLLAAQLRNVLVLILLAATALSAVLGHAVEAVAITVIVVFAVVLGFVQEMRAERAVEALRSLAAPSARVLRDGDEIEVPAREVVPGDVLVLRAGDRVPADGRLLEAVNLQVQEGVLTGESLPVEKDAAAVAPEQAPLGDRRAVVFAGTAVTYGRGRAVVVATGMTTEFGRIAGLLSSVETGRTPLQQNLDRLGGILARAALGIVALIVVLGLIRGEPFVEMLLFGTALAVAVVPEALPAVVAISLALGVQRLARRHALMRRMAAVETLGSTSVICTDKTGTLTRDEMTVRRLVVAGVRLDVTGTGYSGKGGFLLDGAPLDIAGDRTGLPAAVRDLLGAAVLASDATLHARDDGGWSLRGDPTEGAIVVAAAKAGIEKGALDDAHPRVREIPFTSESRRMTTVHAADGIHLACAKGAPEVILAGCDAMSGSEGDRPLDERARARVLADATAMAEDALRVIAVARRDDAALDTPETGMTLLGLVGLIDPPRDEAAGAIEVCREAGIRVVMITGDHPVTATAVARELGLLRGGRVVTGVELDALDDERLAREVETIDVFARVAPEHKLRVVEALQRNGEVVAMTGDGVNDAPALKRADIGIAMGVTGTDVAREAAAMTLTDDDFATIVAAVEEGRGIFGNIKKYLMFLLSSNVGEIGLMAGAAAAGLPLPLTAVQILYVNLATDGLPALALAVDPPERDLMRRPPRDPGRGVFTRPVVTLMLVAGAWAAAVNLALFAALLAAGRPETEATTIAFVALVLVQFWNAFNFRSDHLSALVRPFANRWLVRAIVWELALLLVVVYVPLLQDAFDTYPLALADWALVLAVSATIVPVLELAKWMLRRGWFGATSGARSRPEARVD